MGRGKTLLFAIVSIAVLILAFRGIVGIVVHIGVVSSPFADDSKFTSISNNKIRMGLDADLDDHTGLYDGSGSSNSVETVIDVPELPLSAAPVPETYTSDHAVLRMALSDISHGNLVLINHDHRFDIPTDQELVRIFDYKTPSFRLDVISHLLAPPAIIPLNDMMDAFFAETGRDTVAVISAFRGTSRQQFVLNEHIAIMGSSEAHRWVARPGHSEHHAGLAVDLGFYSGGRLRTFTGTAEYAWFQDNSYNYGYILRFPDSRVDITGTYFEPWHYRYVGLPHSYIIYQNNWVLEEYIEFIALHSQDEPFFAEFDGVTYEIFFTSEFEIIIPLDCEFDISGNNIDGFIVTLTR